MIQCLPSRPKCLRTRNRGVAGQCTKCKNPRSNDQTHDALGFFDPAAEKIEAIVSFLHDKQMTALQALLGAGHVSLDTAAKNASHWISPATPMR